MTPRERFIKTLTFGKPDRIFYDFAHPRRATVEAWYLQGLPKMTQPKNPYARPPEFREFVGEDLYDSLPPINVGILPAFEMRIIEESARRRIHRDADGITMEDAGSGLNTPGFRTRKYVEHPVKTREDWLDMRRRFDPHHPDRYPKDWAQQAAALKNHDKPIRANINGLYWKSRDFIGFENLSVMFYDNPALVHEIMDHMTDFIIGVLDRALTDVEVDRVQISEDMCYKSAMMISPRTFREFMMPGYKRMAEFLRAKGVPILAVDSDGHNGQLIPLLIEAGFNAIAPMEIAAHNDPVEYRKKFGRQIAFWGGIDKREVTTKEKTYREVMGKVPWLLEQGGYRPSIDHAVPPTTTLRGFLYMVEIIKALAEHRRVPLPDETLEIEKRLGPCRTLWTLESAIADEDEPENPQ